MNIDHYKQRLLELEKTLSARIGQETDHGRAEFIDSAHDVGDAADFGGGSEFVNRGFLPLATFLEGFDGDIEANLAAKLEAVGHGLCR